MITLSSICYGFVIIVNIQNDKVCIETELSCFRMFTDVTSVGLGEDGLWESNINEIVIAFFTHRQNVKAKK